MHVGDRPGVVQVVDGVAVEKAGVVDGTDGVENLRITVTVTVASRFSCCCLLNEGGL